jgi:hypothetical protein
VHNASFVRRRHPNLVADLGFAQMEALAHVDGGQGAESVRDMLNEYPYEGCPATCPVEAVNLLFASRIASDRGQEDAARFLSSPATQRCLPEGTTNRPREGGATAGQGSARSRRWS